MKFNNLPDVKTSRKLVKNDKCLIDGEKYPHFLSRIIKMLDNGTQPVICFPADPGHGKTWAMGRLAEILHDKLDILEDSFNPEEQITQDPLKFVRNVRNHRKKMFIVPDADSVFPSDEYFSAANRANRNVIYLSRIFSNILGYDTHELAKTSKSIRTNHNIRFTSSNSGGNYIYKVERIIRKNDSQNTQINKKDLGIWKPDKPSKDTRERIVKLDKEEKVENLKEAEEKIIEERRENKAVDNISFE